MIARDVDATEPFRPRLGPGRGKECRVKKASEYRKHAEECRILARRETEAEHRDQLLEMAAVWEQLARERSELIANHPKLAEPEEQAEEAARPSPARPSPARPAA
jgi:hypothetical protein